MVPSKSVVGSTAEGVVGVLQVTFSPCPVYAEDGSIEIFSLSIISFIACLDISFPLLPLSSVDMPTNCCRVSLSPVRSVTNMTLWYPNTSLQSLQENHHESEAAIQPCKLLVVIISS